jgi:hypothetical protein
MTIAIASIYNSEMSIYLSLTSDYGQVYIPDVPCRHIQEEAAFDRFTNNTEIFHLDPGEYLVNSPVDSDIHLIEVSTPDRAQLRTFSRPSGMYMLKGFVPVGAMEWEQYMQAFQDSGTQSLYREIGIIADSLVTPYSFLYSSHTNEQLVRGAVFWQQPPTFVKTFFKAVFGNKEMQTITMRGR